MAEQQTGEIHMCALVMNDQLVGECEAGHQPSLLHPKYGCKESRKEDSLDSCHQMQAQWNPTWYPPSKEIFEERKLTDMKTELRQDYIGDKTETCWS